MAKPVSVPSLDQVMRDMQERFGADVSKALDSPDLVYNSLVSLWKNLKRPPKTCEIAEDVGMSDSGTKHNLLRLCKMGRAVQLKRGLYAPVMKK